jgi:OmpA-OmpF porin, OOP family
MGRRISLAAAMLLAVLVQPAVNASAASPEDHPLVSSYPDAVPRDKSVEDFASYALVTGVDGVDFTSLPVEGTLTRIRYDNPQGRSVEEIFANYAGALTAAGLSEIFRCADDYCGPTYAAARWGRFNGTINLGADSRYLAGSLTTANGLAYLAIAVAPRQHQVTIVEVKSMDQGLVTVDPDALGDELDLYGHVAIPGVFFETGKAELTAESAAALAAMAQILEERPGVAVWVVGHTDWTGAFDLNMSLSEQRARSVVAALVADYGIEPGRLAGYGVGPLAPSASNGTDSGRTANRRVELVLQPPKS